MSLKEALIVAGVDKDKIEEALTSFAEAKKRAKGLLFKKMKIRWFYAGKIADALRWEDERLCEVKPNWADYDIAPMINITAHGDNGPWTDSGEFPLEKYWLNKDENSEEYKEAVKANYWLPGTHPRSKESRKAWYRRNACEYTAYRLGMTIRPEAGVKIWRGEKGRVRVKVTMSDGAWIIMISTRLIGNLSINKRVGFEVDNIYSGDYFPRMWYPVSGYPLRAPVTNSVVPGKWLDLTKKRWEV